MSSRLDLKAREPSPPPPRTAAFEPTFEQAFGRGPTFLDDSSFQYKAEVIKYFDGEANPPEDAAEFLNTLQAVLEVTTQRESKSRREREVDPVKQGVREKFIELYRFDQAELQRTSHAVHAMVPKTVAFEEEDFGSYVPFEPTSPSCHDPMVAEIKGYLGKLGSALIQKYLAEEDAANPCDHAEEFYALYKAILQKCPKPTEHTLSESLVAVSSAEEILRSQFDALYESNRERLHKRWGERDEEGLRAKEIDGLRSLPFVTDFSASPTAHYRTHHGTLLSAAAVPMRDPMLQPPEKAFQELSSIYGRDFDFERHGLSEISERIIAFYNAAPNVHPYHGTRGYSSGSSLSSTRCFPVGESDLADVIIMVLGTLKQPEQSFLAEKTIDSVVRERFIAIFHYAAAMGNNGKGGLKEVEITGINRLVAPSEQFRDQPILMPPSLYTHGSPLLGSEKGSGTPPGGGGGSSIVKVGLLLLALYLGYRLAKPAYQWIRGNQTTPVGE